MKFTFSKAFIGVFAGVVLLGGAAAAHASTLTAAQVQAVISLLQNFNVDQNTINSVAATLGGSGTTPSPVPTPTPNNWCPTITTNLSYGMSDYATHGQVSELQQYLGISPTGYFGPITRQYVAQLQAKWGLPQVGGIGPMTRTAILNGCVTIVPAPSPIPTPNPIPVPTPTPGTSSFNFDAPFTIPAGQSATEASLGQLNLQVMSVDGATARVTLGENCQRGTQCFYYPTRTVVMSLSQPVAFQSYTITLNAVSNFAASFVATRGVNGTSVLSVTPSRGAAPLAVTFSGSVAGCAGGSFELAYGDGLWDVVTVPATCQGQFIQTHTYASAGSYTATLSQYISCLHSNPRCMIAQPAPLSSATVVVTGSVTTQAPVISSITPTIGAVGTSITIIGSGFTSDNTVRFAGGGSRHVASSNGTTLVYTIPNTVGPCDLVTPGQQMCAASLMLVQPGVYNLSVSNENGQSATMSYTVTAPVSTGVTLKSPTPNSIFVRGQDLPILWTTDTTVPSSASITLDLYTEAGAKLGPIAISQNNVGSVSWHIPGFPQNYMCTQQYPNGLCGISIPTGKYYIKATASSDGFNTNATVYGTGQTGLFTILQQ